MTNYSNFKIDDIITANYITGNQRGLCYDKQYHILDIKKFDHNKTQIKIQNDEGKKVWFNDFQSLSNFKLVIPLSKETLTGNSIAEMKNIKYKILKFNMLIEITELEFENEKHIDLTLYGESIISRALDGITLTLIPYSSIQTISSAKTNEI